MQQKSNARIKRLWAAIRWPKSIPSMAVFIFIATLVIINLIALLFYTNYTKYEQDIASTDEVVSQLLNTIYLMHISPESKWPTIVNVSETPEVKMTLSKRPIFDDIIRGHSLNDFHQALDYATDNFEVSIKLHHDTWLNVVYKSKSTAELMQIFLVILGVVIALALLFSAWTLVRFTRPLREFKRAAEHLGVGLGSNPVIEYGPAIVKETASAMNKMQQRIENLLKDKNQMLAAISHDLRSPITRLKLRVSFISDHEQAAEWLADLDEMETMIEQILTYTKDVAKTEDSINLDLIALIYAVCDEYTEQGYDITCTSDVKRLPFHGRSLALKRAFNNVVSNAIKYASEVSVAINMIDNKVIITVLDDGPGIPEEKLDKVFTAFYRVDSARTASKGGTGLGLAITQDIIHAHQGSIILKNRKMQGLEVRIELPNIFLK